MANRQTKGFFFNTQWIMLAFKGGGKWVCLMVGGEDQTGRGSFEGSWISKYQFWKFPKNRAFIPVLLCLRLFYPLISFPHPIHINYKLTDMMSVVGKSTCSGFKTGFYISYHGGNTVRYIKQRGYFMKDCRISGYFDTKYITVLWIEQILHNYEDQKIANFLTSNRSIFMWHSSYNNYLISIVSAHYLFSKNVYIFCSVHSQQILGCSPLE